uniref:Uncharacterized protein n=1 Tax=Kalanchoe fedtschenkoi TaxID=63787 RepID=A0A7N0ZVE6_KALFE
MEVMALSPEVDGPYDSSADEFYEQIEAPKFVDLTVRDPARVDDRYWFCSRVGCDQKHEEDLDSEEVYKNFLLRVMAARSPNVRLQRALSRRQDPISKAKCPQSAPPKSTRPRPSRLALISTSITKKLADFKAKGVEQPTVVSSTPAVKEKAKAKKSSVVAAKYMTTPRNRNCAPKVDSFRSVQASKGACGGEVKSRAAKALVFPSPKKAVKLKASLELKTPVRRACERLKKLEADEESRRRRILGYSPKPASASKPNVSRPWRVTGPGQTKKCGEEERKKAGALKCKKSEGCQKLETTENDTNDTPSKGLKGSGQVEETTAAESAEEPGLSIKASEADGDELENARQVVDPLVNEASDESQESKDLGESEKKEESSQEAKGSNENQVSENVGKLGKKEVSHDCGTAFDEAAEGDDKENESAPDQNQTRGRPSTKIMKLTRPKAAPKDGAAAGAQALQKYTKPKPTNPKPFRLRTDERSVLKEAHAEKKVRPGKCDGDILSKTDTKKCRAKSDSNKIGNPQSGAGKEAEEKPGLARVLKPSFDRTSAKKPEKPKSILSSGKRKNVTPGRDDAKAGKRTVSFLIPGETTPELSTVNGSEKNGRQGTRKPKNSTRKLP